VIRGHRAYLPSFGATPFRPEKENKQGRPMHKFESSIQALLLVVDIREGKVIEEESSNLSVPGGVLHGPYGIAFPRDKGEALVPLYGNNSLTRIRPFSGSAPELVRPYRAGVDILVGENPRGVASDREGRFAYTVNFGSGDVSQIDLTLNREVARVALGPPSRDRLSAEGRRGKVLFYTTQRVATSADFWMSCGSCHPDGRTDGITWNFDTGPRSTPILKGSYETLPLHFDADRDELSDFEHTVRGMQGGFGLIKGSIAESLGDGQKKSAEWEAIERYIREGVDVPRRAVAEIDHTQGRAVFREYGCHGCHSGEWYTDSAMPDDPTVENGQIMNALHDVGTLGPRDVLRSGGYNTPSLMGVAQTAPYLHDGSALTLQDVLTNEKHLYAGMQGAKKPLKGVAHENLVMFLLSISEGTLPVTD